MAGAAKRTRKRKRKKTKASPSPPPHTSSSSSSSTSISIIGDDLLVEVFLRLASSATLVRAALTCKPWLHLTRDPTFLARFRPLHPPPILGFFTDTNTSKPPFIFCASRSDPDLAAAIRGGDFSLTCLPPYDDDVPNWEIADSHGGRVLLANRQWGELVVCDPLARRSVTLPFPPSDFDVRMHDSRVKHLRFMLLTREDDPSFFRVVLAVQRRRMFCAAVFSSLTWEWRGLPWSKTPSPQPQEYELCRGMQANDAVYFPYDNRDIMLAMDCATMQLSIVDLPDGMNDDNCGSMVVGETEDGIMCFVGMTRKCKLAVWLRKKDSDGVDSWFLEKKVSLRNVVRQITGEKGRLQEPRITTVRSGFVFMHTSQFMSKPCWYLSVRLKTMHLEQLLQMTYTGDTYPYMMARPPSFLAFDGGNLPIAETSILSWTSRATGLDPLICEALKRAADAAATSASFWSSPVSISETLQMVLDAGIASGILEHCNCSDIFLYHQMRKMPACIEPDFGAAHLCHLIAYVRHLLAEHAG